MFYLRVGSLSNKKMIKDMGRYAKFCGSAQKRGIMKKYLYNFDPIKPHFYVVNSGLQGYSLFFLFLLKNIDCG